MCVLGLMAVDVDEEHDLELQSFAGLGIEDHDAPNAKVELYILFFIRVGLDFGLGTVKAGIGIHQAVNEYVSNLIVRSDDSDQLIQRLVAHLENAVEDAVARRSSQLAISQQLRRQYRP